MELIRSKHFQSYLEKVYVEMAKRYLALDEYKAKAKYQDEFMEDANMINFIINSTYPQTKWVNDSYHFITKDTFTHEGINGFKLDVTPGAFTFRINEDCSEHLSFENPKFHHGQVNANHRITCWGGFKQKGIGQMFTNIGLSGTLMDMYNFARVSDHGTYQEA